MRLKNLPLNIDHLKSEDGLRNSKVCSCWI